MGKRSVRTHKCPRSEWAAALVVSACAVIETRAGLTEKLWHRHYKLLSDNLRRYMNHEPLRFTVDKHIGY